jgi:CubicO group peptidase (beta-lactamase class C family)
VRRVTTDKSWTAKLDHLDKQMTGYVERGEVPGLVTMLSGPSEVRVNVVGKMAVDGEPMQRDTLFRVASFTKPIAAVAAMILVDEECLELDRPLDDLLPELAERRVLIRVDGPLDETVPAERVITLRDLLTFRLGLGEPMAAPNSQPIQRAEADLELKTFGPPKPRTPLEPDEWMRRLGTLPLQHQPGKRWKYATGSHLLGVLVARAAGQPLEVFLRERLFEPLGMKDTGFTVPASQLHRLATSYVTSETGELEIYDGVTDSQWCQAPTFPDAAGGLISTADDFAAFARMLLDGGAGIVSPESIEQMTTDQLTLEQREAAADFLGPDTGWGFGVSVGADRYGWAGGLGTSWYSLPAERTAAILLTQRALWTPAPGLLETFNSSYLPDTPLVSRDAGSCISRH